MATYIALVHKDEDSDFGVSFPDLPGCYTAGRTLAEAHRMAAEAVALHLQSMISDGVDVPAASTLDEIMADPANADGGVPILVAATALEPA